jgi:hypothetical protein
MDATILVFTSLGFLIPCFYITNVYFIGLFSMISCISALFWSNNKQNSMLHKIDAFMCRLGIATVVLYKCFINTNNFILFSLVTTVSFIFIYMSNIASSKKWNSREHIMYHMYSHIFLIMSGVMAFLPSM